MRNPHSVLIKPMVSEKSMLLMEENKYCFWVDKNANKIEIKNAVEKLFNVKVQEITTIIVKGKVKRMGKYEGKRSDRKKAIVTLIPGNSIKIFEELQ